MIGSTTRQSSLFYVPLARQAVLLKDDLLDPIDALLDDPELISLVRHSLASRSPLSPRTGRPGIAPDRLLRCCALKHLKGWSLRELERELRSNLIYRRFTRFDADPTPNYSPFSRCFALLGEDGTQRIHDRVVAKARQEQVARGRKVRTDTSVVETIRKGKAHKPTEFGRLVRLDEVENGIVSGYEVLEGNPADTNAWRPALEQHQRRFGRPPRMATADRGYFSAANEREAKVFGVERGALPARGRLSKARAQLQKERWFQRALRWRAGIEARISTLKHPFSMQRATYKGEKGFKRYVGWCVITQNLVSMARTLVRRKARAHERKAG